MEPANFTITSPMPFITLTYTGDEKPVLINSDNITFIRRDSRERGTLVAFTSGNPIGVVEEMEEIAKALDSVRANKVG